MPGYSARTVDRETAIAVIPFGFADGYPRLPAGGTVLVRGQRAPLVGPRHTEHALVDVTDVPGVALGDEVVLLGAQGTRCHHDSRGRRGDWRPADRARAASCA